MSAGLPPQPYASGPSHHGAPPYQLPPQTQQQLNHDAFQQLANFNLHWTQNQMAYPYPGYAYAPAPVPPPQPQPHPQYQPYQLPNPAQARQVQSTVESKEESALDMLAQVTRLLPTCKCCLSEWVTHQGRVLNFLEAFALLIGDRILRERIGFVNRALGSYPKHSAEDVVFTHFNQYCTNNKLTPFPIQPLTIACYLRTVDRNQRLQVLQVLELARIKSAPAFDKLAFVLDVRNKVGLSSKAWALWEQVVQESSRPLTEWRVIAELVLHQPPQPQPSHFAHQPQPGPSKTHHHHVQPAMQFPTTTAPHLQPLATAAQPPHLSFAPAPPPPPPPAPVPRKRGRPRKTPAVPDAPAADNELAFYFELNRLKAAMDQLALKRRARHNALVAAQANLVVSTPARASASATAATSDPPSGRVLPYVPAPTAAPEAAVGMTRSLSSGTRRSTVEGSTYLSGQGPVRNQPSFPALPRPASAPPRPAAVARPSSTTGISTSSFKQAVLPKAQPWSDYTPVAVPLEPAFPIAAPVRVAGLQGLPGRRQAFAPASVQGDAPGQVYQEVGASLRAVCAGKWPKGQTFESVQTGLSVAVGAKLGLGKPSALQQAIALPIPARPEPVPAPAAQRPKSHSVSAGQSHIPQQPQPRRPSLAPVLNNSHKASAASSSSALGVTGLPMLPSSTINRPALASTSGRASSSAGMARTGSNGGRTPSLSSHNIHPLARLYGQISQQERRGVLQMVAARSPAGSQENSPRAPPPASLGQSPLVKYVEMGIEIAEAAVKERQGGGRGGGNGQGQGHVQAQAAVAVARAKGRERMDELVAPPLVPVPVGQAGSEDDAMLAERAATAQAPLAPTPISPPTAPKASPLKRVPLLRPDSPEPRPAPEPSSPSFPLKYAPPLSPSASPPPLTKVTVWTHPGFPSRPADALKRAGAVVTRGVGVEEVRKGMRDVPGWVQRASRPAMPFRVAEK